jgi:hypothetical protein
MAGLGSIAHFLQKEVVFLEMKATDIPLLCGLAVLVIICLALGEPRAVPIPVCQPVEVQR